MFSAGCTMNTGSKKLQREVASTFCGAQLRTYVGATLHTREADTLPVFTASETIMDHNPSHSRSAAPVLNFTFLLRSSFR